MLGRFQFARTSCWFGSSRTLKRKKEAKREFTRSRRTWPSQKGFLPKNYEVVFPGRASGASFSDLGGNRPADEGRWGEGKAAGTRRTEFTRRIRLLWNTPPGVNYFSSGPPLSPDVAPADYIPPTWMPSGRISFGRFCGSQETSLTLFPYLINP
mgnify:CR=1 FL=1